MNILPIYNFRLDFLLITALPEERDAVLSKLPAYHKLPPTNDDIRTYFQADLPITFPDGSTGKYRVAVMCLSGMGRVQAVTATADAIRRWDPRYIMLIGIAGGIAARNVKIGDILISDQIVDYELQKLTSNGPEIRWDVQRADPRLLNACNNYQEESWQELIRVERPRRGRPDRHIGPIASGDKVIAFGKILTKYQTVWSKLLGVEMEAAGVATAAFQSSLKPGFFMVRGVSDLADENKGSSHVEKWRSYACDVAASFAIALLRSGPVPLLGETVQKKTKQVQLIFEGEFSEFTQARQQEIISVLAVLLRIEQSDIRVLKVQQGSVVMIIEMPNAATDELYELAVAQNSRIMALGIRSISVEGGRRFEFADSVKIRNSQPEQKLKRMEKTKDQESHISVPTMIALVADMLGILGFLLIVRQNIGEIVEALGFPENIDFYFLFFYGSVAALLSGLLWNGLNWLNVRLPEDRKFMKGAPFVGGTSRTEPHGRGAIIWSIATNILLIGTLMILNFLYHFIGLRTQALLYIAFGIGAGIGAKLFYDYPVSGKVGFRAYFEAKKYPYFWREFWCAMIWSFLISALGFLFMAIMRWLVMPDLISSEVILTALLKQVGWATGLTTLAVVFSVLIFPNEKKYETARGIIAGLTFRLMLFFGLLIL